MVYEMRVWYTICLLGHLALWYASDSTLQLFCTQYFHDGNAGNVLPWVNWGTPHSGLLELKASAFLVLWTSLGSLPTIDDHCPQVIAKLCTCSVVDDHCDLWYLDRVLDCWLWGWCLNSRGLHCCIFFIYHKSNLVFSSCYSSWLFSRVPYFPIKLQIKYPEFWIYSLNYTHAAPLSVKSI